MIRFLIIVLAAMPLFSQNLQKKVAQYQKTETLQNAQWSVYAQYVDQRSPVINHNGSLNLTPASGLKLFTSAMALDALGSDFKYETRLVFDGQKKESEITGNLVIIGSGDPTLGSNTIKGTLPLDSLMIQWVDTISKQGIKKISGDIITYNGLFDEQAVPGYWYWIDLGNYYAAGSYALNINENLYYLFFKPGKRVRQPATVLRTEPEIFGLNFINKMTTGRRGSGDNGYIYCAPRQYTATLRGTIPAGVNEFSIKGSIPQPELFAAQLLKKSLQESGIEITGEAKVSRDNFNFSEENILVNHQSPTLSEIVTIVNKRSNNLYTEAIGKTAAISHGKKGSTRSAVKSIEQFLESINVDNDALNLRDVCGLSPANTISAKMMVGMLAAMTQHPEFETYFNSMAVAGDADDIGFFSNWGSGTAMANNARVKSGLISRVRSHSGYVHDRNGRLIAFSMIANNYDGSTRNINNMHKKLIIALAELK